MFRPMKPETIARRKRASAIEQMRRRTEAVERLTVLAKRDGPDSIYADLLAEARKRLADTPVVQVGDHTAEPRQDHAVHFPGRDPAVGEII